MSQSVRPLADESVWQAEISVADLLETELYPVWLLGPGGGDFDHWNDPAYRRIRFKDALNRPDFLAECARRRHPQSVLSEPFGVLALHCSTCGHAAVIDGNHRLAMLATGMLSPGRSARVQLTVVSGSAWPANTPDMMKICACLAPQPERLVAQPNEG
jgi:hypothetical protein